MLPTALHEVLSRQAGVVSRRQALERGVSVTDLKRLRARRELTTVFEGVYASHTGPLTWEQRAWAAVLVHPPSALAGEAALFLPDRQGVLPRRQPPVIEVVVAAHRRVRDPPGVRSTRIRDFDAQALLNLAPPRIRVEHAALTVASRSTSPDSVVSVLGDVCQAGRTTPARLIEHARRRTRLPQRGLVLEVLDDVARGANSALERRYLGDVERAHGLPRGTRQLRVVAGGVTTYQDVDYEPQRTVVELDGRLGHERTADRWDDLDRDVAAAVDGCVTLRAGWRQVLEACRLAAAVGRVLRRRGWSGSPHRCMRPGCPVG